MLTLTVEQTKIIKQSQYNSKKPVGGRNVAKEKEDKLEVINKTVITIS